MAAYEQALAGQPTPIGAERTIPGTLRALAVSYFASPAFLTKRPSTRYTYRNVIDRLCAEHGDKRIALLQRDHVVKLLAARAATPGTANALRRFGMAAEQARNLGLDGLRQKRSRAAAQNLGRRVGKSPWLRESENISGGHGVSLLCWRSGGVEHPHDTPPYPFTPSPTFAHSSAAIGRALKRLEPRVEANHFAGAV
jgi:hypothetical protein